MSLDSDPLIIDLRDKINEQISHVSEWLVDGKCSNMEEYRKQTGKVIGFRAALVLLEEVIANYGHDEDEDQE